jgi:hypothetical protein
LKETPVHIEKETGWAPEPLYVLESMKYSVQHCVASRDMTFIPFFFNQSAVPNVEMGENDSLVTSQTSLFLL